VPYPGWCTYSPIAVFAVVVAQLHCDPADPLKTENGPKPPENTRRRGFGYAQTPGTVKTTTGCQSFTIGVSINKKRKTRSFFPG